MHNRILLVLGVVVSLHAAPTPALSTKVASCQEITQPHTTVALTQDLTAPDAQPCLNIHDTSNISLDCGKHSISALVSPAISVSNVSNFSIQNCVLSRTEWAATLQVIGSTGGQISNNTFGDSSPTADAALSVSISQSNNSTFSNNSVYGSYSQDSSSYSSITGNTFTSTQAGSGNQAAAMVLSRGGHGNFIYQNSINGNAVYYPGGRASGTDDGILIADESNDIIATNTIQNNWDCGIEFFGNINSVLVKANHIQNSGNVGIGGFYFFSMSNSTISGNTVVSAGGLFYFSRIYGLRPSGDGLPGDSAVLFQNNVFQNNTLQNPQLAISISAAAYVDLVPNLFNNPPELGLDYLQGYPGPGYTDPLPSQFQLSGNTFTHNNFGMSLPAPFFGNHVDPFSGQALPYPSGLVVDGGGNICAKPTVAGYPLNCHSN